MDDWKALIRGLEYMLMFRKNPIEDVDMLSSAILKGGAIAASAEKIFVALSVALQSHEDLSKLLDQPHSDQVLRSVFALLKHRLGEARQQLSTSSS